MCSHALQAGLVCLGYIGCHECGWQLTHLYALVHWSLLQARRPTPLLDDDFDMPVAGASVVDVGPRPATTSGPEPVPLNHYLQNMISPRSRVEYDEFNRYHFSRLKQGRDRRAVTPKVGSGLGAVAWKECLGGLVEMSFYCSCC